MSLLTVDGCNNYTVLSEAERAQGHIVINSNYSCDRNDLVPGWYRFQGAAGDRMAHTRQSPRVWSIAESVIKVTCTSQTTAVTGVTILQSGIVGHSSCISYKSRLDAIFVTVVTAVQVIYLVCFFESLRLQLVIKQSSSSIIKQSSNTFFRGDSVPC